MRAALLQLSSSDDPASNLPIVLDMLEQAAKDGVKLALTPEVTNCVSSNRSWQQKVLQTEESDQTLAAIRNHAQKLGIWVLIGSLVLKADTPDGRFVNRSFLISPAGGIVSWYDKIHMFDVVLNETETYKESANFYPGSQAVIGKMGDINLGMTICYDVRFPHLHRRLAKAGASLISVPAAFSVTTGQAHWEVLLRARAIETGCFILAPAQTGTHHSADETTDKTQAPRRTYGHSMAVSPWGEVLLDAGTTPGVFPVDIDLSQVKKARERIPCLEHDREIGGPSV